MPTDHIDPLQIVVQDLVEHRKPLQPDVVTSEIRLEVGMSHYWQELHRLTQSTSGFLSVGDDGIQDEKG